jgi:putative hydrolase of the HAD superfamily
LELPLLKKIKVVLFDLGNTLLYFNAIRSEILAASDQILADTLVSLGYDVDVCQFKQTFSHRMASYFEQRDIDFLELTTDYILQECLDQFGIKPTDKDLHIALERMYSVSEAYWHVEADTHHTLQKLKEKGFHLGIISNAGNAGNVNRQLKKADIAHFFDKVLISAVVGIRKPDPRIFEMALAHWGFRPDQAIMVGDLLGADVLGAQNVGMPAVWITRRADPHKNRGFENIIPDAKIEALTELPALLDSQFC